MAVVVWFKRDLRVRDNAALAYAARLSRETGVGVLPVFIVEPAYWRLPDTSGRQWAFVRECLLELRDDLASLGLPLLVRVGEAQAVLADLHDHHDIRHLVSHQEVGNAWTFQRDRGIAAWCSSVGILWKEGQHTPVQRGIPTEEGWLRARTAFVEQGPVGMPLAGSVRALACPDVGAVPTARELGLVDVCPDRQRGGRRAGVDAYTTFLQRRGYRYKTAVSSPLLAEMEGPRISPYLAYGALSTREVYRGLRGRLAQRPGGRWAEGLAAFEQRVAGRDYAMQQFESNCWIEHDSIDDRLDALRPKMAGLERLKAWQRGETGVPFVDACMRHLRHTGWLNFRMRAMLLSFASYHLWLDWRATGTALARLFTDYEPGIHWPMVQMQAGTNSGQVPRIYNPIKQGWEHDPEGVFTLRWCPELVGVPRVHLQEPWRWEGFGAMMDKTYPAPIVQVERAMMEAKDVLFWGRTEPRTPQPAAAQLTLGL